MRIGLVFGIAAMAAAIAAIPPATADTFYVTTGTTGSFSIAPGFSRVWNITPDVGDTVLGGGVFMVRRAAGVAVGVTLSLYDDGGATLLDSIGLSYDSFAVDTYARVEFLLGGGTGYTLPGPGHSYLVQLGVADDGGDSGGAGYDIQGGGDELTLVTGSAESVLGQQQDVSTPEPAGALVLAAGLLGLGLARRRVAR